MNVTEQNIQMYNIKKIIHHLNLHDYHYDEKIKKESKILLIEFLTIKNKLIFFKKKLIFSA